MKKPITAKRLYNIALFYLSKYEASRKQVGDMLRRRVLKAQVRGEAIPADVDEMIEETLNQLMNQHFLSDTRFAENKARHWAEQGKSNQYITQKLKLAGIAPECIQSLLKNDENSELDKARQYVRRKKLGFMRSEETRRDMRQKDLARLARQGFSLDIALKALGADEEFEADEIDNIEFI